MSRQQKTKDKKLANLTEARFYFELIVITILFPFIVLFLVDVFDRSESRDNNLNARKYNNKVEILTNKNFYNPNDRLFITIRNNSKKTIYFEPCDYLNNFEKKLDGNWLTANTASDNKSYDKSNFEKRKRNNIICEIKMPESGMGIYRLVLQVYYNCKMPRGDMCKGSDVFYSNEFELLASNNEFKN